MSCSSCGERLNCNHTKKKPDCEQRLTIDWVPNTACTVGITLDGVTDTLELKPGIEACESKTHISLNPQTGCIEYQNEKYIATEDPAYLEVVCASDLAEFIDLEDLGNVEDDKPRHCSMLVYREDSDCGPGCTGAADAWTHWYADEHLVDEMPYVMGFNEDGCPVTLDKPKGEEGEDMPCAITQLLHDGTNAFWGNPFEFYPDLGDIFPTDPTQSWRIPTITSDSNGCPAIGWLNLDILKPLITGLNQAWTTGRVVQGGYTGEYWWVDDNRNTGTGTFNGPIVPAFPSGTHSMSFSYLDSSTGDNSNASRVTVEFSYQWTMSFDSSANKFNVDGTITFNNIYRAAYAGNPGTITYNWQLQVGGTTLFNTPWTFNQFGQLPGFTVKSVPFHLSLDPGASSGDTSMIHIINSATGLPTDEFTAGIQFKNVIQTL